MTGAQPKTGSAWAPLAHEVFRALWIAALVSDFGAWMHEVGEAWLMTSLSPSPLYVALLQAADSLAVFLLALPAGALADVVDRRRLAMVTQTWLLVGATLLAVLTLSGHMTPGRLIGLTFLMGVGAATDGPVWQAIVPEVVPRKDLPAAITLGSLAFNLARAAGPALGGLVVAAAGPSAAFALNALSFGYVVVVLLRWRRPPVRSSLPAERWVGAMQAGYRYVRHSPDLIAIFVRSGVTVFGSSCLLALLPIYARKDLELGSAGYGGLMGCMGVGAVLSATVVLPRVRQHVSQEGLLTGSVLVFAAALATLSRSHRAELAGLAVLVAGGASMAVISSLNVAVQLASPSWVAARVLSVFMLVFQGAIAGGSVLWGALAARTNLRVAMLIGSVTMVLGIAARLRFRLRPETHDFTPSLHWPRPMLVCEPPLEDGPVLVMVEYRVKPDRVSAFIDAATRLGRHRRRDGAIQWELFRDPASPDRFLETYAVETWGDHMRQHERVTVEQQTDEAELRPMLAAGTEPIVTHLVAAHPREEGMTRETALRADPAAAASVRRAP